MIKSKRILAAWNNHRGWWRIKVPVKNTLSFIYLSIDWLTDWLIDWSIDWLIDWLIVQYNKYKFAFCVRNLWKVGGAIPSYWKFLIKAFRALVTYNRVLNFRAEKMVNIFLVITFSRHSYSSSAFLAGNVLILMNKQCTGFGLWQ